MPSKFDLCFLWRLCFAAVDKAQSSFHLFLSLSLQSSIWRRASSLGLLYSLFYDHRSYLNMVENAEHRHVGSNNFNLLSSRSHTIFTLVLMIWGPLIMLSLFMQCLKFCWCRQVDFTVFFDSLSLGLWYGSSLISTLFSLIVLIVSASQFKMLKWKFLTQSILWCVCRQ